MFSKLSQLQKKKGTKKTDRKRLIASLDQLMREFIKKTETKCCCCGTTEGLQVGHFITRRVYALRWDIRNCHAQCSGCNLRHNFDPSGYSRYMLRTYGKPIFDELIDTKNKATKLSLTQLRETEEYLKGLL